MTHKTTTKHASTRSKGDKKTAKKSSYKMKSGNEKYKSMGKKNSSGMTY